MNYGKFFRLNQNLSRIEEGVTIYDYIDLPAYFEASTKVKMSPKYPISVSITEEKVVFRVHYSAYIVESENGNTSYMYNVTNAYNEIHQEATKNVTHMEEVILELPFKDESTDLIYHAIKRIYNTPFPSIYNNYFLTKLIQARYIEATKTRKGDSLTDNLYRTMHLNLDGDRSYSTLWLMDLSRENRYFLTTEEKDGANSFTRFLRKLLLDFMFDLKHSDVFQTSKYYQAMYSGLMSSFYFSALMHKCEYYFYRGLIRDLIKTGGIGEKEKHIKGLYADQLIDAETLWIQDIMSPKADKYFEFCFIKDEKNVRLKISERLNGSYSFRRWDSWFASPEEEMRRVCFTMKETEENKTHICNAEVIKEYLGEKEKLKEAQERKIENNKTRISQWFLRRYSIGDVLHLHFVKHANTFLFPTLFILLFCIFIFPRFFDDAWWTYNANDLKNDIYILFENRFPHIIIFLSISFDLLVCKIAKKILLKKEKSDELYTKRNMMVWKRVGAITIMLFSALILFVSSTHIINNCNVLREESLIGTIGNLCIIIAFILLLILIGNVVNKQVYHLHWLSNMHVFLPRLIASITAAWLSLAIGNELFGTFFDSIVSWITSISLTIIVFTFVMYEINKLLPREEIINKLMRCCGIMIISYTISLIVGFFIINFTGERFLERSGVLKDFYKNYVYKDNVEKQVENKSYKIAASKEHKKIVVNDDTHDKLLLDELKNIHIVDTDEKGKNYDHPIVTVSPIGGAKFFILRDFLIQFAFVAMFIGIFIQMLFEEKSITET